MRKRVYSHKESRATWRFAASFLERTCRFLAYHDPFMSEVLPLPESLKEETPTTKLLYLWLLNRGEVAMTHQAIANALYTERYLITKAINRLEHLSLIQIIGTGYKKRLILRE